MTKVSFSNKNSDFFISLKKKVDQYFESNNHSLTGNSKLYTKTIILIGVAVATYLLLLFLSAPIWVNILLCSLLGITFAAIGFNIMHDGSHGSYSKKPWVNDLMGYTLNLMGGSSYYWKLKHNINHHSFTNIEGVDDDIELTPWIRLNESQPKYWFHKFQYIYWFLLYGFSYLTWIFYHDFKKYFSSKIGTTKIKPLPLKEHIIFWASKLFYVGVFLVIPGIKIGFMPALIGFFIASCTCGFVISIIFQLAHIVEHTEFPLPEDSGKMENSWAIHQLQTTANFATKSKVVSWFTGGLNHQVEHHLFPRISHIHYPAIGKLVKETCQQYGIKYIEYPSLLSAFISHLRYLKLIGAK